MAELVIQALEDKHIGSFRRALDAVARERKWLAMLEAPALESVSSFVQDLRASGSVQLAALHADHVVGWCDIRRRASAVFPHVGVLGMGVIAEWRGKRVGRRLLETCIAASLANGVKRIELEVFASNAPALDLYASLGFVEEGRKVMACKIDERYEDIVLMAYLDPGLQR